MVGHPRQLAGVPLVQCKAHCGFVPQGESDPGKAHTCPDVAPPGRKTAPWPAAAPSATDQAPAGCRHWHSAQKVVQNTHTPSVQQVQYGQACGTQGRSGGITCKVGGSCKSLPSQVPSPQAGLTKSPCPPRTFLASFPTRPVHTQPPPQRVHHMPIAVSPSNMMFARRLCGNAGMTLDSWQRPLQGPLKKCQRALLSLNLPDHLPVPALPWWPG